MLLGPESDTDGVPDAPAHLETGGCVCHVRTGGLGNDIAEDDVDGLDWAPWGAGVVGGIIVVEAVDEVGHNGTGEGGVDEGDCRRQGDAALDALDAGEEGERRDV